MRCRLPLAKLHEALDELDPDVIHLIFVKVIEWLKEQSGDRGSLLELVFDCCWCKHIRRREDAPHLLVHLGDVDRFVKLID